MEAKARKELEKKVPKADELTPELRERLEQIYQEQYASSETPWRDMVQQISDKLWLKRKIVGAVIHKIQQPEVEISPELNARVIEAYQGYVNRGERPAGGRRINISQMLGIPYHQVKKIVYQWSQVQYGQSPTPELSREQKFAVEKLYWDELKKRRYRLNEIPAKIAEQLGYTTPYQVSRWLDMLHDDDRKFERVDDLSPEIEKRIYEAYLQYLEVTNPPEQGLHATIAQEIGEITSRQVHKALQRFRKQKRAEYPLQ
ncbi:MAG: hypothetical protein L0226_17340 [Acidobacteria bacterium]|nr:hypothetical protein [Acidobacteriota bacterium]